MAAPPASGPPPPRIRTQEAAAGSVLAGEGHHVLIVDDDAELRPLLLGLLRQSGFRATGVRNGAEMREVLASASVDLVLLDVVLPGRSGFDLCRELRALGRKIPVILCTALTEASDRVIGLELGADDFIVKPADPRELVARIRAVLRRVEDRSPDAAPRDVARFTGWTLDLRRREALRPDGAVVDLTSGEFDLLLAFVERPGRVLTRDQLLDLARNRPFGGLDRSMDVQISRLRAKLGGEDAGTGTGTGAGALIKTVRGVGYLFAGAVEWS